MSDLLGHLKDEMQRREQERLYGRELMEFLQPNLTKLMLLAELSKEFPGLLPKTLVIWGADAESTAMLPSLNPALTLTAPTAPSPVDNGAPPVDYAQQLREALKKREVEEAPPKYKVNARGAKRPLHLNRVAKEDGAKPDLRKHQKGVVGFNRIMLEELGKSVNFEAGHYIPKTALRTEMPRLEKEGFAVSNRYFTVLNALITRGAVTSRGPAHKDIALTRKGLELLEYAGVVPKKAGGEPQRESAAPPPLASSPVVQQVIPEAPKPIQAPEPPPLDQAILKLLPCNYDELKYLLKSEGYDVSNLSGEVRLLSDAAKLFRDPETNALKPVVAVTAAAH